MYTYTKNGVVEKYPYSPAQLRKDNPQVSFPQTMPDDLLADYKVYPVVATDRPNYDTLSQNLTEGVPEQVKGVWVQVWIVSEASQEEVEQRTTSLVASLRADRDQKLLETDWVVVKAYEQQREVPEEWASYRQALRDITTQAGFPYEVVWPVKPE